MFGQLQQNTDLSTEVGGNIGVLQQDNSGNLKVLLIGGGAVIGHVIVDSGSITANAGTNLNTSLLALESGGNLATLAGAVSAAKVQASIVTALPAGTNVLGHIIADSGSTTAVTSLPAIPAGTNVIGHVISDTGSVVQANAGTNLNTSLLALENGGNLASSKNDLDTIAGAVSAGKMQVTVATALPAGTAVLGHVIADSGSTTAVTSLPALPAGTNVIGHVISDTGSVVQANAGTNLNTSALALESGGNLATLAGGVSGAKYQQNLAQVGGSTIALGQAAMASSIPIVIASDQSAIALKGNYTLIYSTTQTGISASGDSGDLDFTKYKSLHLLANLTALTGTSVQFKIQDKDAAANYYSEATGTALVAAGTSVLSLGPGCTTNAEFSGTGKVQWVLVGVSSATFTAALYGK